MRAGSRRGVLSSVGGVRSRVIADVYKLSWIVRAVPLARRPARSRRRRAVAGGDGSDAHRGYPRRERFVTRFFN